MQSAAQLTEEPEVLHLILSNAFDTFMETDYEIFSVIIPHPPPSSTTPLFPLIQGQLSVTGKSIGTEYGFTT